MRQFISFNFIVVVLVCSVSAASDTTFTYQGELKQNGIPANGLFIMNFSLWDAASGGNQIDIGIPLNNVPVVDGQFTVELDFGAESFDNSDRWLKIFVNGFLLSPRQRITRVPYAIQTRGIFVDDDENVGIGTSSPVWELEVANPTPGDSAEIGINSAGTQGALAAYSLTFPVPHLAGRVDLLSNAIAAKGLDLRADGTQSDIRFYTRGFDVTNERMRITPFGLVGIGTTNPQFPLDVNGAIGAGLVQASEYYVMHSNGWPTSIYTNNDRFLVTNRAAGNISFSTSLTPGGTALERLTIKPDGKIGIGTSVPSFLLHVDGDAGKPGGGSWSNASDVRLKKNIEPIDDALGMLLSLRGVNFEYIDPESINELPGQRIGMIAQEVEKVVPDWVEVRDDGYKTVTHRGFEALTVEALRELKDEKDDEIKTLKDRISKLEQLVEQLASSAREQPK